MGSRLFINQRSTLFSSVITYPPQFWDSDTIDNFVYRRRTVCRKPPRPSTSTFRPD